MFSVLTQFSPPSDYIDSKCLIWISSIPPVLFLAQDWINFLWFSRSFLFNNRVPGFWFSFLAFGVFTGGPPVAPESFPGSLSQYLMSVNMKAQAWAALGPLVPLTPWRAGTGSWASLQGPGPLGPPGKWAGLHLWTLWSLV